MVAMLLVHLGLGSGLGFRLVYVCACMTVVLAACCGAVQQLCVCMHANGLHLLSVCNVICLTQH